MDPGTTALVAILNSQPASIEHAIFDSQEYNFQSNFRPMNDIEFTEMKPVERPKKLGKRKNPAHKGKRKK